MISLEKGKILTTLQKLSKNGEDFGKIVVAKGFEKLPKVRYLYSSLLVCTAKTVNPKEIRTRIVEMEADLNIEAGVCNHWPNFV